MPKLHDKCKENKKTMPLVRKKYKGSGKQKKSAFRQSSRFKTRTEDEPRIEIEPSGVQIKIESEEACLLIDSEEICIKIESEESCMKIEPDEACVRIESEESFMKVEPEEASVKIEPAEPCSKHANDESSPQTHFIDRPVKIHSDAVLEVWYKADSNTGVPESYANLQYISPLSFESIETFAMFDLFKKILKDLVAERLGPIHLVEASYEISPGFKGLWIKANGFNQKLPNILKEITRYMTMCWTLLNQDLFDLAKEDCLHIYRSHIMNPEKLAEDVRRSLTILHYWSNTKMYTVLSDIEFNQFQDFVKRFTDHMYVQCYVQGNMESDDVIDTALQCIEILNCRPLLPNTMPHHSMNKIPRGIHCCRVRSFSAQHSQSFVTNYYQFEDPSFKLVAMIDYLSMIMANFLPRDNECDLLRGTFGMFGYSITGIVLDEDTVEDIDYRIESLRDFFNRAFTNMTKDHLLCIKKKLMTVKKEEVEAIDREDNVETNWNEIMMGQNSFNRKVRELEMINKMTVEELRMWMMKFTMGEYDARLRKLTIQIVGYDNATQDSADTTFPLDNGNGQSIKYSLTYLTRLAKDTKKTTRSTRDYYITDIADFRRTLDILPWQNSSL